MTALSFGPLYEEIRAHAAREYPRESCGLILLDGAMHYRPCRNRAIGTEHFILHEEDYAAAADAGDVLAVVHSHPDESANPSMADRAMCERTALPWLIVGWPGGHVTLTTPQGFRAPLLGREFSHGVLDCYELVRDYYRLGCGIEIPHFERHDDWWKRGEDLYMKNFEAAGFVEVNDGPRLHDGLLIQVCADQANHAAVFLGDGRHFDDVLARLGEPASPSVGTQLMLHHLHGRLSCRDVYGGYWQRHTRKIVRHRSLLSVPSPASAGEG